MKTVLRSFLLILCCLALLLLVKLRTDSVLTEVAYEEAIRAGELFASRPSSSPVEYTPNVSEAIPTPQPTPEPTPEPQPEYFTLSCIGDCTLWASAQFANNPVGLPLTVGSNLAYPFSNTVQYFADDEFTLSNLECTLSDTKLGSSQQFYFLAPTAYSAIMLQGGVDFVTTANNHTMDFGEQGMINTCEALTAAGLPYGTEGQAQIVTTPNGLTLGIYTAGIDMRPDFKTQQAVEAVVGMKQQGVDLVICMFHWGQELYYSPNQNQVNLAHAVIDAGCDIVYGSHPHCLQPIEKYGNGLILYSVGNWCFGGSTRPSDPDTAIVQIIIKRDPDGTVSIDSFNTIPCCVSSNLDGAARMADNYNNYCPTPYAEGTEQYERVLAKLSGQFKPAKEGADYSNFYASWG